MTTKVKGISLAITCHPLLKDFITAINKHNIKINTKLFIYNVKPKKLNAIKSIPSKQCYLQV